MNEDVIELSDDEAPVRSSTRARRKRSRPDPPPGGASTSRIEMDLTLEESEDETAPSVVPTKREPPGAKRSSSWASSASTLDVLADAAAGSSSSDKPFIMIDLCDEEEDEAGGGAAFAQQLNLLFDGDVEIVSERKVSERKPVSKGRSGGRGGSGGAAEAAIEINDDDTDGEGDGDEDEDARMAARMQAAIDADARAEAERLSRGDDADAAFAARLQARLAREIAESEEQQGPRDVLRAQRNQIRHWLQQNATMLNVRDVWSNPASLPGGELYRRFAAAHEAAPDKAVRLVFHGTREENIKTICQHGLDPKFRGKNGQALGAGEYFAERPDISLAYCAGGKRMLVFGAPPAARPPPSRPAADGAAHALRSCAHGQFGTHQAAERHCRHQPAGAPAAYVRPRL